MTIPKKAGLSHLADASNEQALTFHYPIKKKGEPRRLRPNLDAIRYLEIEAETDTEIHSEYDAGESVFDEDDTFLGVEFKVQRALGYFGARQTGMYPWPMFQTFPATALKAKGVVYLDPCPACDDWSRTSRCEEHHDRDGVAGLGMGDERRRARRSARDARQVVNAYTSPDRATAIADYFALAIDNSEAGYTPRDGRQYFTQADQDIERQRQRAAQAGLYVQAACTCSMCTGPRATQDNPMLDELLPPVVRERWAEAVASLPNGTIDISNATIEVNGETLQGVQSFTIHIERNTDGT